MRFAAVAVLLVALVAGAVSAQSSIAEQAVEVRRACAAAHNITPEYLAELKATVDKSTIVASDDLKCFARCAIEKSGLVSGAVVNVERIAAIAKALGKDEVVASENAVRCSGLAKAELACDDAWEMYKCFRQ